mgnify:CR=1 FL=1
MDQLKSLIREVPDYPKPGILFYDITTLLKETQGLKGVIDGLHQCAKDLKVDRVAGIEARGFIFGPALAYALGTGFVPIRKPKKLPAATERVEYALEYGTDTLQIHADAIKPDTESGLEKWLELNAEYAKTWPNITQKGEPPADAKEWDGQPGKYDKFFSPKPGQGS